MWKTHGPFWESRVLQSVVPVVEQSRHVRTVTEAIDQVAGWMAYEQFHFPSGPVAGPFDFGSDPDRVIDVGLLAGTLNFAFTEFASGVKFEAVYQGRRWSDSEAMFACIHEAVMAGVPLLDGEYLATVTEDDLARIFHGNIAIPMLAERAEILNAVGQTLTERYGGRFHRFVADCRPAMYAGGDGLMERLIVEFPRFDDSSDYRGHTVELHKLAQLSLWTLHMALHADGRFVVEDLDRMTAFADYIVPVSLRVMGILDYTAELAAAIDEGWMIERASEEEVEIRAHTLYSTALLTDAINRIRPGDLQLVIPQVDFRLWSAYHATFAPHHLTRTTMY